MLLFHRENQARIFKILMMLAETARGFEKYIYNLLRGTKHDSIQDDGEQLRNAANTKTSFDY